MKVKFLVTAAALSASVSAIPLPDRIAQVMNKPRYAKSTWSLLVTDLKSGESYYELNADQLSYTGSTRKLFSVGVALKTLGAEHHTVTHLMRRGPVDKNGIVQGNLTLQAAGDLTLGGRSLPGDQVEYTSLDHNDANGLGTAMLTQQDPLRGLNELAAQVKAAGIRGVRGKIEVDDSLFEPYRVPNGNLLITPMMLNENQIDVSIQPGPTATVTYRPKSAFFVLNSNVTTGSPTRIQFSEQQTRGGSGLVEGMLAADYKAPLSGAPLYVRTVRVEDPNKFASVALAEALGRQGVVVVPSNAPWRESWEIARFISPPLAQQARLVLKVSLNLGANLFLSLFGLEKGERTIQGALAAERKVLIEEFGLKGEQFSFPTNGSGTPDSQAAPRALVTFLIGMHKSEVAQAYFDCLPVLGVDGSLATSGTALPGRGHVFAKPGTTVMPDEHEVLQLKAQNLAGYIHTKSGRKVAYALMVNEAGPVQDIAADVGEVFEDESVISSVIYESL